MMIKVMSLMPSIISPLLSIKKRDVTKGSLDFVIFLCALKSIHNFSRIFCRGSHFQFNPSIYHLGQGLIHVAACFVIQNWKPIIVEEIFNHIQIKRFIDELSKVSNPEEQNKIAYEIFNEGAKETILRSAVYGSLEVFSRDSKRLRELLSAIEEEKFRKSSSRKSPNIGKVIKKFIISRSRSETIFDYIKDNLETQLDEISHQVNALLQVVENERQILFESQKSDV